jgi:hypothetical protein
MKQPLFFNKIIVGYADEVFINENNIIESIIFYLFNTPYQETIISEIKKSMVATFDDLIDITDIRKNTLYNFELNDNVLKINLIK